MVYNRVMRAFKYLVCLSALLCMMSCRKGFEVVNELGVTSRLLELGSESGSTHIMVYSKGSWTVRFDKETEWASLNKLSGEGVNDFIFGYSANYGITRGVNIVIEGESSEETVSVVQTGTIKSPNITPGRPKVVLPRQGTVYKMDMRTNLAFCLEEIKARAVYYDNSGNQEFIAPVGDNYPGAWIGSYKVTADTLSFEVAPNEGAADRTADLVFYVEDASGAETRTVISVMQSSQDPVFSLTSNAGSYYANGASYLIPATGNNIWSLPGVNISCPASWIGDMSVTDDGLQFSLDENMDSGQRSSIITVSYSKDGYSVSESYEVTQSADKVISFSELRDMPAGQIDRNIYIEGFIVSDPSSKNICSSPQTGQYAFDRSENDRTAYMESTDGVFGIQLKFTAAEQNIQPRWSRVLLNLNGTVLSRQTNPDRYTVSGIQATMISLLERGDESSVPSKVRSISQIGDNDIFTYVRLSNVEIMCKDGAFTNASEGYAFGGSADPSNPSGSAAPRWDVAPLLCSDPDGSVIYMLTNAAVPWRRTGRDIEWNSCVPQGAGTLGGIIVADDVAPVRWGDLGRYQIRAMTREEIALDGECFSNTIAEWTWNDFSPKITPDSGHGTFNKYNAAAEFVPDFNNPYMPEDATSPNGNGTTNLKGLVQGAAICLKQQWWDFTEGTGKYFDIRFSTAGLNGTNLIFGIVWGHGSMNETSISGPSHWNVLYSTDGGTTFKKVPSVDLLKKRSVVWWGSGNKSTSQDATPGYTEHLVKLPSACFGQSNVVIRLQVADTVTDIAPITGAMEWQAALGIERGMITSAVKPADCQVRIGTITVRYN